MNSAWSGLAVSPSTANCLRDVGRQHCLQDSKTLGCRRLICTDHGPVPASALHMECCRAACSIQAFPFVLHIWLTGEHCWGWKRRWGEGALCYQGCSTGQQLLCDQESELSICVSEADLASRGAKSSGCFSLTVAFPRNSTALPKPLPTTSCSSGTPDQPDEGLSHHASLPARSTTCVAPGLRCGTLNPAGGT